MSNDALSPFDNESLGDSFTVSSGTAANYTKQVVKRDNRIVTLVRGVVLVVLLSATVLTSYAAFRISRDSEIEAFHDAFQAVASKLAPGLISEVSLRVSHFLFQSGFPKLFLLMHVACLSHIDANDCFCSLTTVLSGWHSRSQRQSHSRSQQRHRALLGHNRLGRLL